MVPPPRGSGTTQVVVDLEATDPTVRVSGEFDDDAESTVAAALDTATTVASCDVVVDLADVTFIGSSGLRVLAATHVRLREQGGALVVQRPSDSVLRVLEYTGLRGELDVRPGDRRDATDPLG